MSGWGNVLVIVAVIGIVIARQLRPRRVGGGRWWLIPAVLVVLAVRDGGFIDPHHQDAAIALFAAELVVGGAMGIVWAGTTRIWAEADGAVWMQGTRATITVWMLGIAVRAGLYAVAAAEGVHQQSASLLITVAATLLIRTGVLFQRAQGLEPSYRTSS
jgi:hypothetical protein